MYYYITIHTILRMYLIRTDVSSAASVIPAVILNGGKNAL